jgi:hypothetical protein
MARGSGSFNHSGIARRTEPVRLAGATNFEEVFLCFDLEAEDQRHTTRAYELLVEPGAS